MFNKCFLLEDINVKIETDFRLQQLNLVENREDDDDDWKKSKQILNI